MNNITDSLLTYTYVAILCLAIAALTTITMTIKGCQLLTNHLQD